MILLVGVNGSGKTTTAGKLAARFKSAGKSVLLCAADTFRAAAIEQLQVWGGRTATEVIAQAQGADPSAVVFDAIHAARARQIDVLWPTPRAVCTPRTTSWPSWKRCAAPPAA